MTIITCSRYYTNVGLQGCAACFYFEGISASGFGLLKVNVFQIIDVVLFHHKTGSWSLISPLLSSDYDVLQRLHHLLLVSVIYSPSLRTLSSLTPSPPACRRSPLPPVLRSAA